MVRDRKVVAQDTQTTDEEDAEDPTPATLGPDEQADFDQQQEENKRSCTKGQEDEIPSYTGGKLGESDEKESQQGE